jgi:hypothetical protein
VKRILLALFASVKMLHAAELCQSDLLAKSFAEFFAGAQSQRAALLAKIAQTKKTKNAKMQISQIVSLEAVVEERLTFLKSQSQNPEGATALLAQWRAESARMSQATAFPHSAWAIAQSASLLRPGMAKLEGYLDSEQLQKLAVSLAKLEIKEASPELMAFYAYRMGFRKPAVDFVVAELRAQDLELTYESSWLLIAESYLRRKAADSADFAKLNDYVKDANSHFYNEGQSYRENARIKFILQAWKKGLSLEKIKNAELYNKIYEEFAHDYDLAFKIYAHFILEEWGEAQSKSLHDIYARLERTLTLSHELNAQLAFAMLKGAKTETDVDVLNSWYGLDVFENLADESVVKFLSYLASRSELAEASKAETSSLKVAKALADEHLYEPSATELLVASHRLKLKKKEVLALIQESEKIYEAFSSLSSVGPLKLALVFWEKARTEGSDFKSRVDAFVESFQKIYDQTDYYDGNDLTQLALGFARRL